MTTGVQNHQRSDGPSNHAATLNNCEDRQAKTVTTLWGDGRNARHGHRRRDDRDHHPRHRARLCPISPTAIGNPTPKCRQRLWPQAATDISRASWWK
ncbi:hypothetical protein M8494_27865 [Serratia ureilytica]